MEDVLRLALPAVAALVTHFVKKAVPAIPKWLIPIFASVLGAVGQALAGADSTAAMVTGGLASVGVREVLDQLNKRVRE